MSRRRYVSLAVLAGAVTLVLIAQVSMVMANGRDNGHDRNHDKTVLEWDTMVGIPAGLTGAQSLAPLRGINGGGIAWAVKRASGELESDGDLEIKVDGLVLAAGANAGSNPSATFRGLVSCVAGDGSFVNILTDPFPATTGQASAGGGDARIRAHVALPTPCIAPIVFVTSATGSWFAATGN